MLPIPETKLSPSWKKKIYAFYCFNDLERVCKSHKWLFFYMVPAIFEVSRRKKNTVQYSNIFFAVQPALYSEQLPFLEPPKYSVIRVDDVYENDVCNLQPSMSRTLETDDEYLWLSTHKLLSQELNNFVLHLILSKVKVAVLGQGILISSNIF